MDTDAAVGGDVGEVGTDAAVGGDVGEVDIDAAVGGDAREVDVVVRIRSMAEGLRNHSFFITKRLLEADSTT